MDDRAMFSLIGSAIVSAPLAYSSTAKLMGGGAFASALANYGFFPKRVRSALARIAPGLEMALAISTVVVTTWWSAAAAALVYGLFVAVLVVAWSRGARGDCGCFGVIPTQIGPAATVRAAVFMLAAAALAAWRASSDAPGPDLAARIGVAALLATSAAVLSGALAMEVNSRKRDEEVRS